LFEVLIPLFFIAIAPASGIEPAAPALSLPELVSEAREKNPAILAARKRWLSEAALVLPARTWDSPVIGIHRKEMPTDDEKSTRYSIEQEIPFPGKRSSDSRMKFHEAKIAEQDYRAKELEIVSQVKIQYHRLAWLSQTAAALRKDAEILRTVARVAQSQVSAGRGGAQEALIAQTQLKKIENAAFEREEQRHIAEEDLNALLAAPPGTRRGLSPPLAPKDLALSVEQLAAKAQENNPMFLSTRHMVSHAYLMTRQGRYGFAPDFTLFYEQERFRRRKETIFGTSLSIPLWFWAPAAELRSARAHTEQALAESRNAQNETFRELHKEHTEVRLHRTLALSYEQEIVPLAEAALKIAQKNYETGREEYSKLAAAVSNLLEVQMIYYEELYHYGEHWAILERIVGVEL
jgi:outer membrane protein TolC